MIRSVVATEVTGALPDRRSARGSLSPRLWISA